MLVQRPAAPKQGKRSVFCLQQHRTPHRRTGLRQQNISALAESKHSCLGDIVRRSRQQKQWRSRLDGSLPEHFPPTTKRGRIGQWTEIPRRDHYRTGCCSRPPTRRLGRKYLVRTGKSGEHFPESPELSAQGTVQNVNRRIDHCRPPRHSRCRTYVYAPSCRPLSGRGACTGSSGRFGKNPP